MTSQPGKQTMAYNCCPTSQDVKGIREWNFSVNRI